MRITKISLKNFGSYYGGEHEIDFDSKSGADGYAIFGQIGRGKTTLIKAIMWCLYGHVEASVEIEGKSQTKTRPVVDSIQHEGRKSWCLPLLNDKAYLEGDCEMQVVMEFENEGKQYTLLRMSSPKTAKKPHTDKLMKNEVHLSVDKKNVAAGRIEHTIEEMMPEKISKFFFVEVDSISSYSALLYSEETGGSIVEDVERILGMPAIDKSEEEFVREVDSIDKKIVKEKKKLSGVTRDTNKLERVEGEIKEARLQFQNFKQQIDHLEGEITEIENDLSGETTVTELIDEKKKHQSTVEGSDDALVELYQQRRELLSGSMWSSLVQNGIEEAVSNLQDASNTREGLIRSVSRERERIDLLAAEINQGGAECTVCGNVSEGISDEEKESKAANLVKLESSVEELQGKIESCGDPTTEILRLVKYKDSAGHKSLSELEYQLGVKSMDKNTAMKSLKEVEKQLEEHDEIKIAKMAQEKRNKIEFVGNLRGECGVVREFIEEKEEEKKKLVAKLPDAKGDTKITELELKSEVYKWLSKCFKTAMTEYKEAARESVENIATDAWKKMIPTPKKYKELRVSSKWNVEVIGANGKILPIGNPGHRQTLAVCIFDGLRKTSNLQFPTFFDNPGSNISDEVIQNMADYFWADKTGQMVMLSHSGGLKENEAISKYGNRLAGAWRISYTKGDDAISEIEKVV